MDVLLKRATPLVLLVLAGLVWFERVLPGVDGFRSSFGEDALPRFVIGVLCLYVLLLVIERQRMETAFKEVLTAFRDFHTKAGKARGGGEDAAQREAMRILIAALDSPDAAVRATSVQHLERLSGERFGDDAEAWRRWFDDLPPA